MFTVTVNVDYMNTERVYTEHFQDVTDVRKYLELALRVHGQLPRDDARQYATRYSPGRPIIVPIHYGRVEIVVTERD